MEQISGFVVRGREERAEIRSVTAFLLVHAPFCALRSRHVSVDHSYGMLCCLVVDSARAVWWFAVHFLKIKNNHGMNGISNILF